MTLSSRIGALLLVGALGAAAISCSAPQPPSADAGDRLSPSADTTPPDPCKLVTVEQVSAAFGRPVLDSGDSMPLPPFASRVCEWRTATSDSFGLVGLGVNTDAALQARQTLGTDEGAATLLDSFRDVRSILGSFQGTDLPGVGDQAKIDNMGSSQYLQVVAGHTYLEVTFLNGPDGASKLQGQLVLQALKSLGSG